jgi:hypothetical protein
MAAALAGVLARLICCLEQVVVSASSRVLLKQ